MKKSQLEADMLATIQLAGLSEPTREFRFHPKRRWRFDFAWPGFFLAIEAEGQGRHNTIAGMTADCEKYNTAQLMGWQVYRFTSKSISNGDALEICEAINNLACKSWGCRL